MNAIDYDDTAADALANEVLDALAIGVTVDELLESRRVTESALATLLPDVWAAYLRGEA